MKIHHMVEHRENPFLSEFDRYVAAVAARVVSEILWDVTDRRGWRQAWDGFDDDIKRQIVDRWLELVRVETKPLEAVLELARKNSHVLGTVIGKQSDKIKELEAKLTAKGST